MYYYYDFDVLERLPIYLYILRALCKLISNGIFIYKRSFLRDWK